MDRRSLAMARSAAAAGGRGPIVVAEEVSDCDIGGGRAEVCSTVWKSANGIYRAVDPMGEPCEGELSAHIMNGRRNLRGIYSDCDFTLIRSDVPNNDLGVIDNFRHVVHSLQVSPGSNRVVSAVFADPLVLSYPQQVTEDRLPAVGIYLRLAFQLSLTIAPQITITTSNIDPVFGTVATVAAPNRTVTLGFNEGCTVIKLFLPFAQADLLSDMWAPRGARIQSEDAAPANNSTVTITGLPTNGGSAYLQWVSPVSPQIAMFAGAINNNG